MLTFAIIISIIALVICIGAFIYDVVNEDLSNSVLMGLLIIVNAVCLIHTVDKAMHKGEPETYVVKDVKEYYVDSTIVINGVDTTKTYTITYLK